MGARILRRRKEKGLTQEALANTLGVSNQAVSKWESDVCCPDIALLPQLVDALEMTLDELFGRERKAAIANDQILPIAAELPWEDDDAIHAVLFQGHRLLQPKHGSLFRHDKYDEIRKTVEYCNQIKISERHPYAGNFVFTAFSGSHQDAIKKGLEAREAAADRVGADLDKFVWLVPYLPIDPKDIGRTYEAIIRVNSQSGKGGMAYLLKTNHNLDLPKRLQVEFDKIVQNFADTTKKEVKDENIWRLFKDEYLPVEQSGMTAAGVVVGDTHDATLAPWGRLKLLKVAVSSGEDGSDTVLKARVLDRGVNVGVDEPHEREISGIGNGPIAAFLNAVSNLGIEASVMDYVEHTMSVGTDAMAASYVECQVGEDAETQIIWGVGIDSSITTSALKAIISAINRSQR